MERGDSFNEVRRWILLVKIIMISLIVRANTSHGLSLHFDYHLACASLPSYIMQRCVHQCVCFWAYIRNACMCWNLHYLLRSCLLNAQSTCSDIQLEQKPSTGSRGGCEKPDKDTGEETLTQRAALPDQYTNTNADIVIDKPLLTTEGRKLSTITGWNVSHSFQWCALVSCQISSGNKWKRQPWLFYTCYTGSPLMSVAFETVA